MARVELDAGTKPDDTASFAIPGHFDAAVRRDRHGNALGGVRTPYVDVPTARYAPNNVNTERNVSLQGAKFPFDKATLKELYGSRDAYSERVAQQADELAKGRWLLPRHADAIKAEAVAMEAF